MVTAKAESDGQRDYKAKCAAGLFCRASNIGQTVTPALP
jgi:hypothetical protein